MHLDDELIQALDTAFLFSRRPSPVGGEFRPSWRIAVLLLILNTSCRGGRSSFPRLHVLNWGLRSSSAREALMSAVEGTPGLDSVLIRYEPSFHRAIILAKGLGLIDFDQGKRVQITDTGKAAAEGLVDVEGVLEDEKAFLAELGYRLTEKLTKELVLGA